MTTPVGSGIFLLPNAKSLKIHDNHQLSSSHHRVFFRMTFKLSPVLKEDIPAIVDLLYDTFNSPNILKIFPNLPAVRKWWADCLYRCLEEEDQHVAMMVMVEETSDGKRKIGAFAKWSVEQGRRECTHWSERWRVELPEEMSKEFVDAYYKVVEEQQAADMGQRRHWCKIFPPATL